jgi:hypothetical protein
VHENSDVLIVGSTFRINIPFKNPPAGVEELALKKTDDSKDRLLCYLLAPRCLTETGQRNLC